jgi:hypothetical protein
MSKKETQRKSPSTSESLKKDTDLSESDQKSLSSQKAEPSPLNSPKSEKSKINDETKAEDQKEQLGTRPSPKAPTYVAKISKTESKFIFE